MVQDKFPYILDRDLDKKLPQIFKNNDNAIFRHLLECFKEEFNELQIAMADVESLIDFDNNFGIQLDLLGSNIKENREGETDPRFRARIKAMMYAANSLGDENTIIQGLASYLNIANSHILTSVVDIRTIELKFPAVISIRKTDKYVRRVKAAGIKFKLVIDIDIENNLNHFSSVYSHIDEEILTDWRQ